MLLAFKSDWLYPTYQSQEIAKACKLAGVDASYCEVSSTYGHDAFLLETDQETSLISNFLNGVYNNDKEHINDDARHADRIEYRAFVDWVFDDASVLDLGCGNGELLSFLIRERHVRAQGIELSEQAIISAFCGPRA